MSPDGDTWELVDLSNLVGIDDSLWGVEITARAHRSQIVVIVARADSRTLLVGEVDA